VIALLTGVAVFTRDANTAGPASAVTASVAPSPVVDSPTNPELEIAPVTSTAAASTNFAAVDSRREAQAAYAAGDFAKALTALERAVATAPNDPDARNNLGQLLVRQGRARDALPHFDEAVRLVGNRWDYRFNRARAYGLVDRWSDAVVEYRTASQLFPEDHATLYNLGLALMRVRDYTAAAVALEQAVNAGPDEHGFLITLGTAYVGAEQPDRARATFEKFLQLAPDDAEAPKVKALLQSLAESGQ
jgi:tetratricopeptide (TPR) repeat protein